MSIPLFTNNASTTLALGVGISDTTINLYAGSGALFPTPAGSNYFYISLISSSTSSTEIMKCTNRTGDVLTVVRGQDGTSAQTWNVGDRVELRVTAASLNLFANGAGTNTGTAATQVQEFTATQGQTVFTLSFNYIQNVNNLAVFVNGSKQISSVNYSESTTSSITFSTGLNAGDLVEVIYNLPVAAGQVDASNISYTQGSTGSVTTNVQAKLQQTVSVKDFGAVGDGVTDDTTAINNAINYINSNGGGSVVIPNGTYIIGAYTVTGIATGVAGIVLLDNVNLIIQGTVKVKNNAYGSGAFYGAIRSLDVGLNNASITGTGTINGNSGNQVASTQCNNIYLTCSYNVVVNGINSFYSNGMGIQIVPVASSTHTACAVQNCFVNNSTNIGIQVAHGLYCNISNNRITTCANNGIDVYGENGTSTTDDGFISIANNNIGGVLVGIFVETSSRVSVVGNTIGFSTTGIATNRINGQPNTIVVSGNAISSCATGMFASGDSGSVLISNNCFSVFTTAGLQIGVAGGNISYVNAFGNVFSPSSTTSPVIYVTGVQASFNIIRQNYLTQGSHNSAYLIVNDATTNITNTLELPINDIVLQPVKQLYSGTSTSGGTATLTLPANSAGKLIIKSVAGGAWESIWSGSFTSSSTRITVAQDSTAFTTPGNSISNVVGSSSTLIVTITFAASGSSGIWTAWAEYF